MKIGLISDTHIPEDYEWEAPPWITAAFTGARMILHAGDIIAPDVLEKLVPIAPVYAVRGNTDGWSDDLPVFRVIDVGVGKIVLAHRIEEVRRHVGHDCIAGVFGHTHARDVFVEGRITFVNPGSATRPRDGPIPSVAVATVGGHGVEIAFFTPSDANQGR